MHHNYLDALAYGDSPIHRLDPRVKLSVGVLLVCVIAITPYDDVWRMPGYAALVLAVTLAARLPLVNLARRILLVLPFVLAVAVLLPFRPGGDVIAAGQVLGLRLAISREGLRMLVLVAVRGTLAVWVVLVLTSTTRFYRLLAAADAFGLPRLLAMQLSFLYRYLFVVAGEGLRMRRARDARRVGRGPFRMAVRAAGGIVGVLFLRSFARAERIYQAMIARGFDGRIQLGAPLHLHAADWLGLVVGMTAVATAALAPLGGSR